jgi:hypothetical protein
VLFRKTSSPLEFDQERGTTAHVLIGAAGENKADKERGLSMSMTLRLGFNLLDALAVVGCSGATPGPEARSVAGAAASPTPAPSPKKGAAETVELHLDEPRVFDDGALTLTWIEVRDSRCPEGVQCVWAGEVTIVLTAAEKGDTEVPLELSPAADGGPESKATGTERHALTLLAVEPYPKHGTSPARSSHIARLLVARR